MRFFPEVFSGVFDNGLKLYVVERPGQPAAELQCHVRTGSIHEGEDLGCGLSHFLEHMLFQGCRNYPGTAVSDRIGELGGEINAYTGFEHTVYHAEVPAQFVTEALDVLAMMVRYPEFPEARFAGEREVILRECELGRDHPDRRLLERLWSSVFLRHNARCPIIGYPDRIAAVTRERMTAYYQRRYTPGRVFFLAVGAVKFQQVYDALAERLADWDRGILAEPVLPTEPEQTQTRETDAVFADPLARIGAAVRLPESTHRDIPALDVLCGLTGMGDASRLVRHLRQERELAVDVESFGYVQPFGGVLGVVAGAVPARLGRLEKALRAELENIRLRGFSHTEVEREKRQQYAAQLRQLRSNGGISATVSSGIYAAGAPRMAEDYLARLAALSSDEVNRVAAHYLSPERFSWVRQTPARKTAPRRKPAITGAGPIPAEGRTRSGMRTVYLEDRKLPLIDLTLVLPGGAVFETGRNGITQLLSDLLSTGCRRWNEAQLADRLERCGAEWRISGGRNSLMVQFNAPRRYFRTLMDLLLAMLSEPLFPERALLRERNNALEELRSRLEQPRYAANRAAARLLFGEHPYGIGESGTPETLTALTGEQVRDFYQGLLHRPQMVCALGGDLSAKEAMGYAEELDAALPVASAPMRLPAAPCFPETAGYCEIPLTREQTVVCRALPGSDCLGEDHLVLQLLHDAMNGLSSHLFKLVREENALAYTTGMRMFSGWHPGMLSLFAVTAAESAPRALDLLRQETERLAADGLTGEEFREARDRVIFSMERLHAEVGGQLQDAALSVFYGEPVMRSRQEIERLRAMTPEETNPVLRKYLSGVAQTVVAGRLPER